MYLNVENTSSFSDVNINGNVTQIKYIHLFSSLLCPLMTEDVFFVSTLCALIKTHVLYHPQYLQVNEYKYTTTVKNNKIKMTK